MSGEDSILVPHQSGHIDIEPWYILDKPDVKGLDKWLKNTVGTPFCFTALDINLVKTGFLQVCS